MNIRKVAIFIGVIILIVFFTFLAYGYYDVFFVTPMRKSPKVLQYWGNIRNLTNKFKENNVEKKLQEIIENEKKNKDIFSLKNVDFLSENDIVECPSGGEYFFNENGIYCNIHGSVYLDPYGKFKINPGDKIFNLKDLKYWLH
jgi:hypothetical protein